MLHQPICNSNHHSIEALFKGIYRACFAAGHGLGRMCGSFIGTLSFVHIDGVHSQRNKFNVVTASAGYVPLHEGVFEVTCTIQIRVIHKSHLKGLFPSIQSKTNRRVVYSGDSSTSKTENFDITSPTLPG